MTTANAEILDKLAKLLALATDNANENEAAAAMAAASRLMEQHKIERAEVEAHASSPAPSDTEVEQQTLDGDLNASVPTWKSVLANGIANANGCTAFTNRGFARRRSKIVRSVRLDILGTALDVAATKYLYAYAVRQIDHFTTIALHAAEHPGRTWANNFRNACVERVCERYEEASTRNREAARATASGPALVRIKSAEDVVHDKLEKWSEQLKLKGARSASVLTDEEARAAGRAAGDLVDLGTGPSKAALESGAAADLADDV